MESPRGARPEDEDRGEQNELGYYNADENETYDERGGPQGEATNVEEEQQIARDSDDE